MISRITKRMQVRGEGGFTLIELLVVIIIIAILAAIAIPMYLSQRQKGWQANVKSDLRNAAVAEESYYTDHSSTGYANTIALISGAAGYGYNKSTNITMSDPVAGGTGTLMTSFCLQGFHVNNAGDIWHYDSSVGQPEKGPCGGAVVVP